MAKIKLHQTQVVALEKLTPWDRNPRARTEDGIELLTASIKKHGFTQPIVTDENYTICIGHARYIVAKKLGLKEVPVIRAKLSKAQFKALNIVDNKSREHSSWDTSQLLTLLDEIKTDSPDMLEATGFLASELDAVLGNTDDPPDEGEGDGGEQGDKDKGIRLVQLFFSDIEFEEYSTAMDKLLE